MASRSDRRTRALVLAGAITGGVVVVIVVAVAAAPFGLLVAILIASLTCDSNIGVDMILAGLLALLLVVGGVPGAMVGFGLSRLSDLDPQRVSK